MQTENPGEQPLTRETVGRAVEEALGSIRFVDIHTHLFQPKLGRLGLWGVDDLLTYHYLEAELFRASDIKPEYYWSLSKEQKADIIWRVLFVQQLPVSEATRGVVAVLRAFDLPTDAPNLSDARAYFGAAELDRHIDKVFAMAGISEAVMTNDPLDPEESALWTADIAKDKRFHAALRLDRILESWPSNWQNLTAQGYQVDADFSSRSANEVRRFLAHWFKRTQPVYMAVSLPDSFRYEPGADLRSRLLEDAVLPACRECDIPLSLMIGVRRQVNPRLKLAGDAAGYTDLRSLETLCRDNPDNRFLVSVLSRENQHELCVYARKFNNLMPFGCWWFLNNPSIVEEITRERIEMLGTSFIPQHSDARILEQVIYKWRNTRRTLAPILTNSYGLLIEDGRRSISAQQVRAEVERLFRTNFANFCGAPTSQA